MGWIRIAVAPFPVVVSVMAGASLAAQFYPPPLGSPHDPGVRGGAAGAGAPIAGLTPGQHRFFDAGQEEFAAAETVPEGLGPRFNLNSCGGCHAQPAVGGTSPAVNPQIAAATLHGARNVVPPFIKLDGPVREARFVKNPDGSP